MKSEDDFIVLVVGNEKLENMLKSEPERDRIRRKSEELIEEESDGILSDDQAEQLPVNKYNIKVEIDDPDWSSHQKIRRKYNYRKKVDFENDSTNEGTSNKELGKPLTLIAELKTKYKKFDNELLIIDALEQEMKTVKPPELPKNYYYIDEDNTYRCLHCDTSSQKLPVATRHYYEKHGPRYLKCYACGDDFRSNTNLYKHEKRCHAPDARLMLKARARFLGRKGRQRPYLVKYNDPEPIDTKLPRRFRCSSCSASFVTKTWLDAHENLHRGVRPYCCHICPNAYTSQSCLQRHLLQHSNAQYICDHCGRSFKFKGTLISHMYTHRPERKFACSECDRRYAQRAALEIHVLRVHKNLPYPFGCPACPKRYPRMSILKKHMQKVHSMKIVTRKMFVKALPTQPPLNPTQVIVLPNSRVKCHPSLNQYVSNGNLLDPKDIKTEIGDNE